MSSVTRRLRRSAAALKDGPAILEWLEQTEQRTAMIKATDSGLPAVAGISAAFLTKFGRKAAEAMIVRQFVGRAVKHIMRGEGYEPADTGVKLPDDAVFSSGTRYAKSEHIVQRDEGSFLARFVTMLNADELRQLQDLVGERQ